MLSRKLESVHGALKNLLSYPDERVSALVGLSMSVLDECRDMAAEIENTPLFLGQDKAKEEAVHGSC